MFQSLKFRKCDSIAKLKIPSTRRIAGVVTRESLNDQTVNLYYRMKRESNEIHVTPNAKHASDVAMYQPDRPGHVVDVERKLINGISCMIRCFLSKFMIKIPIYPFNLLFNLNLLSCHKYNLAIFFLRLEKVLYKLLQAL